MSQPACDVGLCRDAQHRYYWNGEGPMRRLRGVRAGDRRAELMALPHERTMPTTVARWSENDRGWLVELPGRLVMLARDEAQVEELVRKFAYGASIRYVRTQP